MRNFRLVRDGEAKPIAEGVVFSTERGVIQWLNKPEVVEFYRISWVEMMFCRDEVTRLVWEDAPCTCGSIEQDILVKS
jgi:hypothetical protein